MSPGLCLYVSVSHMSTCLHVYMSSCLHFCKSPCLLVSTSPCLYVSMSPCLRVFVSPCLRVSMFICRHISMSPHIHVSLFPCLYVFLSPCLLVSMSPCPWLHVSGITHTENWTTENGKFRLSYANRNRKRQNFVCLLQTDEKRTFIFLGRQTITGKLQLLIQQTCPSLKISSVVKNSAICNYY
jgi:hypothetical protein